MPRSTVVTPLAWRPRRGRALVYAGAGLAAGGLALRSDGGSLGLGSGLPLTVVAVLLEVLAALDLWFGTTLSADEDGIRISRGPWGVDLAAWAEIEQITASSARSRGLQLASLEIDLGERLIVISRHRLGSDPVAVARTLRSMRPSGGQP